MTSARVAAALLIAAGTGALWAPSVAAKGFAVGSDFRVTCEVSHRAEPASNGRGRLSRLKDLRPRPVIAGCATLRDGTVTVQLSVPPRAPFHGCVLDSYTVGRSEGGILCTEFSRVFGRGRQAVGQWITRLGRHGPSVALGVAGPHVRDLYLWYTLTSGAPALAPAATVSVDRHLAHELGAPASVSYVAAALPPDADLCQETFVGGVGPRGVFGPVPFLDTSFITRTEGDGGLTETPRSPRCVRQLKATGPLMALGRMLSPTLATLVRAVGS